LVHDLLDGPVPGSFDGLFALDVLEHIEPKSERAFLGNCFASLTEHGAAIIGMPSLGSQAYASPASKAGHVNCKSMPELRELMLATFHNVFMFSMNDEVVHTGHHKMAHYLWAVGAASGARIRSLTESSRGSEADPPLSLSAGFMPIRPE
jgi:predicted SAM-dependent methyltransferase